MSGKSHNIHSSVSVFYKKKEIWNSSQTTIVKFRRLTEEDVDVYLSCCGNKILSSVGCFQLEEMGPNIIENIKGDFFNVLGFPLFPFLNFIQHFGEPIVLEKARLLNLLPKLPSLHIAWLLFYYCAAPRLNHLLRTIQPNQVQHIARVHDSNILETFWATWRCSRCLGCLGLFG